MMNDDFTLKDKAFWISDTHELSYPQYSDDGILYFKDDINTLYDHIMDDISHIPLKPHTDIDEFQRIIQHVRRSITHRFGVNE